MSVPELPGPDTRKWVARGFTAVEDIVYVALGLILACFVFTLLASGFMDFIQSARKGELPTAIIGLLDQVLLILLIVELLYTVQVSFREHALVPEPFLLIGLISAIRRVLILTAEFGEHGKTHDVHQRFVVELGVLTVLIIVLVVSLVLMRKVGGDTTAKRQ
jgi:uncharacterized membrane protein (DUF373 family)